jgi:hypothetical protein
MQTQFLDTKTLRLKRREGALILVRGEQKTPLAPPRRALPLSNPDEYIVLSDSDGEEIGWLRRVADLEASSRAALEATLKEIYVVTRIARIREVEKEALSGQIRWRVEIARDETDEIAHEDADDADESTPNMGARLMKKLSRDRDETETSSEEREFFIAGTEDVQSARYPQIFIVDTERNRYVITDCEALDVESRRAAERYF